MNKTRLEAFSDGVLAIIITIMVLEMKAPEGTSWEIIKPLVPKFMSYALSFLFVAIYWVNHHHLLHTVKRVKSSIMWANINLLFWLSLIHFATAWMGENHFEKLTVTAYALLALLCGLSFNILQTVIYRHYKDAAMLAAVAKGRWRSVTAIVLYVLSIPVAWFVSTTLACTMFLLVSIIWLLPDKHIEEVLNRE
jgi:uncharacterized membrane protein